MWSVVAALWRYWCEVRYGRTEPTKEAFTAFWMAELGTRGTGNHQPQVSPEGEAGRYACGQCTGKSRCQWWTQG